MPIRERTHSPKPFSPVTIGRTLSKSDYILARSCSAKLFFRENGYRDGRQDDSYLQLLAQGGYMVEALAKARYKEGIEADHRRIVADDAANTRKLLTSDRTTLFGATLLIGRQQARADILRKDGDTIRLIEVKAKSFDGSEHAADIQRGGVGSFRGTRKPHAVLESWRRTLEDVTFQTLLLERMLPGMVVCPSIILVDKSKRARRDDIPRLFEIIRRVDDGGATHVHTAHFIGTDADLDGLDLLTEVDVSAEVATLRDEVEAAAAQLEARLDGAFEVYEAQRGAKCNSCEFHLEDDAASGFVRCWSDLAAVRPHVLELFSIGKVKAADGTPIVESLFASGKASLFDIPEERLVRRDGTVGPEAERQLRQIAQTRSGVPFIGPQLKPKIDALVYPLYFIDFEASRLALPYHARMRPYGMVAFQWSCHSVAAPGATPTHTGWLNGGDLWPNRAFTDSLRLLLGDRGSVLTWSAFEKASLADIARELSAFDAESPELAAWLSGVDARMVDLEKWSRSDYYHPGMRGRTSIKVVLDALWKSDDVMRAEFERWTGRVADATSDPYASLPALEIHGVVQDVREGMGAIRAYEAMMYGVERDDVEAKAAWCRLLEQYCALDTLSMVLVLESWRRCSIR